MSQFGMHLPGGQLQRTSSLSVYTGLLFLAVIALAAACIFVWVNAGKVGKDGGPFGRQEGPGQVKLKADQAGARN